MTHEVGNSCQMLKVDNEQNEELNADNFFGDGKPHNDDDSDSLGPLPSKWEKAFTASGEVYFIDHSTSTSHWLDPRLSKFQKKSLEDCLDDELPYGWEKIFDPNYGTYFIDHVNRRTQYENPVIEAKRAVRHPTSELNNLPFTRNPNELQGERIRTSLVKSSRGLGFTIIGGDDDVEEFLQIKSVVPKGPAWLNGQLETGDVIVYVNEQCVLGYTHNQIVRLFQSINVGSTVTLEVCKGYPLPFDPNDPNTEVVTTVAVDNQPPQTNRHVRYQDCNYNVLHGDDGLSLNPSLLEEDLMKEVNDLRSRIGVKVNIVKGNLGFGFTIADSACGQRVKQILDRQRCKNLMEGDILMKINDTVIRNMAHDEVVQILKNLPYHVEAVIEVERLYGSESKSQQLEYSPKEAKTSQGSKTPTAEMYSSHTKDVNFLRSNTPLIDTRCLSTGSVHDTEDSNHVVGSIRKSVTDMFADDDYVLNKDKSLHEISKLIGEPAFLKDLQTMHQADCHCYIYPGNDVNEYENQKREMNCWKTGKNPDCTFTVVLHKQETGFGFRIVGGIEDKSQVAVGHIVIGGAADLDGRIKSGDEIISVDGVSVLKAAHRQVVRLISAAAANGKVVLVLRRRAYPHPAIGTRWMKDNVTTPMMSLPNGSYDVTVHRNKDEGFGFVIISSSNKLGPTIGRLIEDSPAEKCGALHVGDLIIAVNHINVTHLSHGDIVGLIKESGLSVTLSIAPYDI